MDWFRNRGTRPTSNPDAGRDVVLFIDIFTNYHEPEIGKAAVRFLESTGHRVIVLDIHESGRPQLSKGMVDHAKNILDRNLPKLASFAEQGYPIIGLEPSEILTLRDEYPDLCNDDQLEAAQKVAESSFTFEEFAENTLADRAAPTQKDKPKVYIHGHCHTKALVGNGPTEQSLKLAGYEVEVLETGCCGMAGSFGYEKDHYDVSMDIGELTLFPALRSLPDDAIICTPGFSCRHQIVDGVNRRAYHPAQLLADILH